MANSTFLPPVEDARSPFAWKGQPSALAQALKPSPKARVNLAPKRMHHEKPKNPIHGGAYMRAVPSTGLEAI